MSVPQPRSLRLLGAVTWVLALGPSLLVPVSVRPPLTEVLPGRIKPCGGGADGRMARGVGGVAHSSCAAL